jgi:hypothetical protein
MEKARSKARKNARGKACRGFRIVLAGVLIFLMWFVRKSDKKK